MAANTTALPHHFGTPLVNRMLETAPTLASRAADTLLRNYGGWEETTR